VGEPKKLPRKAKRRMLISGRILLASLYLSVFQPWPCKAQQNPVPAKDLLDVRIIGEGSPPDFSPDGEWVAYALRNNLRAKSSTFGDAGFAECSGVPWHALSSNIVLTNVASGEDKIIGEPAEDSWLAKWSPSGRYLAFLSDRDGSGHAKLWVWERDKNRLTKIADTAIEAEQIEWVPDSKEILTTIRHASGRLPESACRESPAVDLSSSKGQGESTPVIVYESNPHSGNESRSDPWNLDRHIRDLAFFNVETGEVRALTDGERVEWFELSPDGSRVAYSSATRFERPGSQQIQFDLAVVARTTGGKFLAAHNVRLFVRGRAFTWSRDSSRLIFETGGPLALVEDCYRVNFDGSRPRNLTSFGLQPTGGSAFYPPVFDPEGRHIYFLREGAVWTVSIEGGDASKFAAIPGRRAVLILSSKGTLVSTGARSRSMVVVTHDDAAKHDGFYSIDLTSGAPHALLEGDQRYWFSYDKQLLAASPDRGTVVFPCQDAQHPLDLWVSDSGLRSPRRLTHMNPGLDRYEMGAARLIQWQSLDGNQLAGALLLPPHFEKGKRYPLIVWVYGGASLSDDIDEFGLVGLGQPFNLQLFATRGYAVLAPDAPQHLGTPMIDLAKTVLPGIDRVVEMGIADPARIGVMGYSYGGYSVFSLLVLTTRFKAAIVGDGFADLVGAYGQLNADGSSYATSREQGQELMGGTPWEYRDRYVENSPIFYLDRIVTPLLLVHGAADTWVHAHLADEVFVGLRRLGKEVTYAKYSGEDHTPNIWSARNQLDLSNRIIDWFKRFLDGG